MADGSAGRLPRSWAFLAAQRERERERERERVVQWARSENLTTVETSVDPKNASSLASFNSYSRKHSVLFAKIDTVDLIDLHDASFREFEELYLLNLANFTD